MSVDGLAVDRIHLVAPDAIPEDYEQLIGAIEAYGDCAEIQRSVWVLVTTRSARVVAEDLSAYLQRRDRLFVGALVPGESAWLNALCGSAWLQSNL